jgi:hypothetical protein
MLHMTADARSAGASEMYRRSQGSAVTTPHSAALMRRLAQAMDDDAPLKALLGQDLLDRPLAGARLLAGVHDLVLAGEAPELQALVYRTDPDAAPAGGDVLWGLFRQLVFEHSDEMRAALNWPVQQHLPGRAKFLLTGLAMLGRPRVRIFELGACAGLNLQLDKYHWQGPGWTCGDSASPVRFRLDCPCPPRGLEIVERGGCDIAPVDPRDPVMSRRLHAFVPFELSTAHKNLDAALTIAADQPLPVDRAPAQEWLERRLLEQPAPGVHTVIWHSHLWQLLEQTERNGILGALFAVAKRYPVSRVGYEPYEPGGPETLIVETFQ